MTELVDSQDRCAEKFLTRRATYEALDDLLDKEFPVLDHGFIRVVDYMGTEASIVRSARVSYGKGTKTIREDEGLIRYLLQNSHTSPFEMCEIVFHIKAPMFVGEQWLRHRTGSFNKYSGRYSVLDNEFYIPSGDQVRKQSPLNKQGRGGTLDAKTINTIREEIKDCSIMNYQGYQRLLNDGLARELARGVLPANVYTQWYWKVNLHNLMHFLKLRCDPHAQYEIREYANKILEILEKWVPTVADEFDNSILYSKTITENQWQYLTGLKVGPDDGMTQT